MLAALFHVREIEHQLIKTNNVISNLWILTLTLITSCERLTGGLHPMTKLTCIFQLAASISHLHLIPQRTDYKILYRAMSLLHLHLHHENWLLQRCLPAWTNEARARRFGSCIIDHHQQQTATKRLLCLCTLSCWWLCKRPWMHFMSPVWSSSQAEAAGVCGFISVPGPRHGWYIPLSLRLL
jgi:hypothetical protein